MKQIESLATGLLDEAEAASVREHIEHCQACRALRDECFQNQAFAEELKSAVKAEPPRDLATVPLDVRARPVVAGCPAIEGYEVGELLGEGGQGVVYRAIQQFPRREVVIKLLKDTPGSSSSAAAKRFEREILIAARLRHQGIVTVHDSGVLPDGRRFCVMEYVHGEPLTQYVRERGLSLGETLELFARVCDAVSYAHQRGIMHRDLKPSNILVDADGQPKVVDFGLARTVGQIDDVHVSRAGQVVGAPAYMSPEQTRGNPDEIDVRTDVYSLGVILYELLTGTYPYDVESDLLSLITRIREQQPTPPTTAWKTDSGIRPARRTRWLWRERLPRCPIDREIETIVLVCLRKERDRRYQSAGELARDIRRYLNGDPIDAKRDSLPYVLRKWLWRQRKAIATGLLVGAVVLAAIVWGVWYRARQQAELDRAAARAILAGFVQDLPGALGQLEASNVAVKAQVKEQSRAGVASTSFADRVTGARSAFLLDPDAFWRSVDGGPLWTGGEWLELCRTEWPDRVDVIRRLAERARTGTNRQKYVAFCLLGQIARPEDKVADLCAAAVLAETHHGVVNAARWAAGQLGKDLEYAAKTNVLPDDLLQMVFIRVPGSSDFRQGSPDSESDRHANESRPAVGQRIEPFLVSVSEVTVAAFAGFMGDPAYTKQVASRPNGEMTNVAAENHKAMLGLSPAQQRTTPVSYVSLELAGRFIEWLNKKGTAAVPPRRYRLPTEAEWEWACRGDNEGRFCFGSNADYLKYFANCNGEQRKHLVAQRMPNWYGLFDTHGGVWEWTSSRYEPTESDLAEFPDWGERKLFVKRGGAFYSPAVRCRSAQRNCAEANSIDFYTGLRLVMELNRP